MAYFSYTGIGIEAIAVCVPRREVDNFQFGKNLFDDDVLLKTVQTTGVYKRRVVDEHICTSDLCFEAAKKLIEEKHISIDEIDVLIFVSQTPDYRIPASSCLLHNRLGLSKKTLAFDINMGCSGYVYGLSVAYTYACMPSVRKVLLLVGDTVTKFASKRDKSSALLFGDAGSATIVQKNNAGNSYFSLNTDGSGFEALHIKSGGYRNLSSVETLIDRTFDTGSIRNDEQLIMNGGEIFNFTIREVPKDINGLLDFADIPVKNIHHIVLHQANKFMLDFLVKKINCNSEQIEYSLENYGNTSSASIPLTIVSKLQKKLKDKSEINLLIAGFGVGLSWASAIIPITGAVKLDLIEL